MLRVGTFVAIAMLLAASLVRGADRAAPPSSAHHWAFEPVRNVEPPADASGWSDHPIDRFIAAKLQEQGLVPGPAAERRALARRAYFDLIGLPPEPAEVEAFVDDQSPLAFERLVDRLLASPRFGERQGRHWMDVVRYADTAGDNADYPIPEARRYRDYIVDAFNDDKPYDRFVEEQLAGDILAGQCPEGECAEKIIATGFIALSRRYATAPFELMHLTLEDTIETTGRAFLGLTLRCARCHDHKFDPVTREDYYALYGIFSSTSYAYAGSEELASKSLGRTGFLPIETPAETAAKMKAYDEKLRALESEVALAEKEKRPADAVNKIKGELRNLKRSSLPRDLACAYAAGEGKPADAAIQALGDPGQPGPVVARGAPKFLCGGKPLEIATGSSGRLELARWIARRENPLTARVMVNRVWQHLFGRGIVASPSNFGTRGDPPTHPELLDWLAARFVDSGWSMKSLYRLIATSRTYQLASSCSDAACAKDPGNLWLARHDRRRLDAEALRDAMLAVSGQLDLTRPGVQPFPDIDTWGWTQHNPFKAEYASNHRSVYLMTQRIQRNPFLALFDGPDTNTTTDVRTSSIVPQQALFLMNSPFVHEQAMAFARRLLTVPYPAAKRIELAFALAFGRPPEPVEVERAVAHMDRYAAGLAEAGAPQEAIEAEAWASYARVLLASNEFLHLD